MSTDTEGDADERATTITRKGQVTIPKELCEEFGLEEGAEVVGGGKPTTGSSSRRRHSRPVAGDIESYQPVFVPVQKGHYSETMAKRIIDELGEPVDSTAGQAALYEDIADGLAES